jgi:hypothetical protein
LPTKLDAKHQKLIDDLNAASNADFDKTYANQQVDGHKDAVSLFDSYAKKGDNAVPKPIHRAPGTIKNNPKEFTWREPIWVLGCLYPVPLS